MTAQGAVVAIAHTNEKAPLGRARARTFARSLKFRLRESSFS